MNSAAQYPPSPAAGASSARISAAAPADGRSPARCWAIWVITFIVAAVLYWLTSAGGVQWQDSGEFQLRVLRHEVTHRLGLALAHPLHHWLARAVAATGVAPADAVTLVSVLTSAAMLANIAVLLRLLGCAAGSIVFATGALAVAHTVWMHATISEVYGLVGLTLSAELACLAAYFVSKRPGWLVLVALFNGLGVANHLLCGLVTPVHAAIAAWVLLGVHRAPGMLVLAVLAWLAGSAPYTYMIVGAANIRGWSAALHSALTGDFDRQVTNVRFSAKMLGLTVGYLVYNFPNMALPLAALSVTNRSVPKVFYRILAVDLLILLIFAMRYDVPDQFVFFYPCYPVIAIFAGLGLDRLLRRSPSEPPAAGATTPRMQSGALVAAAALTSVAITPLIYYGAYWTARQRGWLSGQAANKPYRDGHAMFLLPWNHDKRHAAALHAAIVANGSKPLILCADSMIEFALLYDAEHDPALGWQVVAVPEQGKAPPEAVEQIRAARAAARPIVLVPRNRDQAPEVFEGATWERRGDIYVLGGAQ